MQTFEGNVGKKIFFGVFVGKEENRKGGHKAMAPLHTPRAFFRVLDCGGRKGIDLCLYAAVVPG